VILAIDPGNEQSAFVLYDDGAIDDFGKQANTEILEWIDNREAWDPNHDCAAIAIEMIASYGMPVGREVFETCVWIGRLVQIADGLGVPVSLVYRKDVKLHLCNSPRANDATIRQALIDRYGGKDKAIGKKATPGPLYGISADVWSALAIAVTYAETRGRKAGNEGATILVDEWRPAS